MTQQTDYDIIQEQIETSATILASKYMGVVISNGQTYNNIVPALVDEETFKACNEIMDNQRHKQKVVQEHSPYILSGKLFCGNCGTLMTAEDGTSHTGKV